jgi:heme-degrading monooxygenase HmoA
MIIRLVRIQLKAGMQAEYEEFLRTKAIPNLQNRDGLLGLFLGPRLGTPPTEQIIIVLLWRDLAALQAFLGSKGLDEAAIIPGEEHMVERIKVENYENLDAGVMNYIQGV